MQGSYKPEIIAHRGSPKVCYENTLPSFEQSIVEHADRIEFDIHETADHVFVVHHDPIVKSEGKRLLISRTRYSDLENLSLPDGSFIPRLEDVVDKFSKRIKFNIEIKPPKIDKNEFEQIVDAIADPSTVIVSSFHRSILEELRFPKQDYNLAYLYTLPLISAYQLSKKDYIHALNPYIYFLSSRQANKYHSRGKKVYVWVANNRWSIHHALQCHADGIITDYPERTRKIVEEYLRKYNED